MINQASTLRVKVIAGLLSSGLLMTGCSSARQANIASAPQLEGAAPAESTTQNLAEADTAAKTAAGAADTQDRQASAAEAAVRKPQLVKNASLSLSVKSVDAAFKAVRVVIAQQQADLLGLQDSPAPEDGGRHTLSMQIRVSQDKLDATLEALGQLGTIESRNLTAEDVSNQLVDFEARLRNLRKTESTLLTIMDRSGSVADVLKVAQELSRVRDETERISAQIVNLKNRVTFSQISLTLVEVIATSSPQRPLGAEFQEAWEQSTHSMSRLTTNLGKLGIWLLAYTPYWLLLGGLLFLWKRQGGLNLFRLSQRSNPSPPGDE